mgnify:CR=1 FL=1
MGKHSGKPANEPGRDLVWQSNASPEAKAANFDAYDQHVTDSSGEDKSNPYSKENFNK